MKIFKQIPLIMSEVGAIEKSRQGSGINYKFRGIDDIYFALQPLLAKHGVFFAPNVIDQQRHERESKSGGVLTYTILKVEFTFYADDGSSFKVCTVGEAMDTSDKSSNKAMSAALKYAILELFCIPTEEEKDTEYQNHEPKPRQTTVKATGFKIPQHVSHTPHLTDTANYGDFGISFGKFSGKMLRDVHPEDLENYEKFLRDAAVKAGKSLSGKGKETADAIEIYLKGLKPVNNQNSDIF